MVEDADASSGGEIALDEKEKLGTSDQDNFRSLLSHKEGVARDVSTGDTSKKSIGRYLTAV